MRVHSVPSIMLKPALCTLHCRAQLPLDLYKHAIKCIWLRYGNKTCQRVSQKWKQIFQTVFSFEIICLVLYRFIESRKNTKLTTYDIYLKFEIHSLNIHVSGANVSIKWTYCAAEKVTGCKPLPLQDLFVSKTKG